MWNPYKPLPSGPSEPPPDPSSAPKQYRMIQGDGQRSLVALEPPRVPLDLLHLEEGQGLELEPYPTWSTLPPPPVREEVVLSWPVRSMPIALQVSEEDD